MFEEDEDLISLYKSSLIPFNTWQNIAEWINTNEWHGLPSIWHALFCVYVFLAVGHVTIMQLMFFLLRETFSQEKKMIRLCSHMMHTPEVFTHISRFNVI